jgi:hypothetical protein
VPVNDESRPEGRPLAAAAAKHADPQIVPDPEDRRARAARRRGAVELAELLYGRPARLDPSPPPGPATCAPGCEWCGGGGWWGAWRLAA